MVIANGYIRVVKERGGGFDVKGNPIEVTEELGHPISCNFKRNSYQGKGVYDGGTFTSASYVILIDCQPFKPCRFKLYTVTGVELGEYEAKQKGIVELWEVGNIEITV